MPWLKRKGDQETSSPYSYDPNRQPQPTGTDAPQVPSGDHDEVRFRIQDIYTITGVGTVLVGMVEAGTIRMGQKVRLQSPDSSRAPLGPFEVTHMMQNRQSIAEAGVGARLGISVRGLIKSDAQKGDYLSG